MLQVTYRNGYVIDVGFYGMSHTEDGRDWENGFFAIQIILDCDWEHPVGKFGTDMIDDMAGYVERCIKYVRRADRQTLKRDW